MFLCSYVLGLWERRIVLRTLHGSRDGAALEGFFRGHFYGSYNARRGHRQALVQSLLFSVVWFLWPEIRFLLPLILLSFLLTAARTDSACGVIPDGLTLVAIAIGLTFAFLGHSWGDPEHVIFPTMPHHPVLASLAGGLLASSCLLWLGIIFEFFTDREGFGFGDVKLAGLLGVFLGWDGALRVLFYAAWIAILGESCRWVFLKRFRGRRPLTLAPYILLGALLHILLGLR